MSEINKIKNIEYDPKIHTAVMRMTLDGKNRFGRPSGTPSETACFLSETDAQQWICEGGPEFYHHLWVPFPKKTFLSWVETTNQGELLIIKSEGRKSVSARSVEGHHGIQTKDGQVVKIIIHVEEIEDPEIERGLAWISPNTNGPLTFVLNPGEKTAERLQEIFSKVESRSRQVFDDLMKGTTIATDILKPSNKNPESN